MRKFILILTMLFATVCLSAQNDIYFGLKAGLNLSSQKVDNPMASYSLRPGFTGGFLFYFQLKDFAIQPEVIFSQQGSNITFNDEKLYAVFTYFSIPIIFKYVLKKSGISFQAGPQIGFLSCAKSNYHPIAKLKYEEQYYTTAYKTTDFLLSFGIGWESKKNWIIDARYSLGLTPVNNYDGIPDTKNRVISITVGYKIVKLNK
ncbi:MAG: PorT family protein [Bacteroidales bacterium]|nr:PorT family protein [Bacteroidales bacterium]MCF6342694.1 PorT family protein [Bacteroidales bacterium]